MNEHVHPIFAEALKAMSDMSIPERPLQPPHFQDVEQPQFDPSDDDQMKSLFGRVGPAIGGLLMQYRNAKLAEGSYGLDPQKFMAMVMPELKQLADDALSEFVDSL